MTKQLEKFEPSVQVLCNKCGAEAPVNEKLSSTKWKVVDVATPCECGGTFAVHVEDKKIEEKTPEPETKPKEEVKKEKKTKKPKKAVKNLEKQVENKKKPNKEDKDKRGNNPEGKGGFKEHPENINLDGKKVGTRDYATLYREAIIKIAELNEIDPDDLELEIVQKGLAMARKGHFKFYKDTLDRLLGQAPKTLKLEGDVEVRGSKEVAEKLDQILNGTEIVEREIEEDTDISDDTGTESVS